MIYRHPTPQISHFRVIVNIYATNEAMDRCNFQPERVISAHKKQRMR
jgi:hypothetical protein